jgi:hypothetical protein
MNKNSEQGQSPNLRRMLRRAKAAHLLGPISTEEIKSSKLLWQNATTDARSPFFSIEDGGRDAPFAMVHTFFARLGKELLPAHGVLPTWHDQKDELPTPGWGGPDVSEMGPLGGEIRGLLVSHQMRFTEWYGILCVSG